MPPPWLRLSSTMRSRRQSPRGLIRWEDNEHPAPQVGIGASTGSVPQPRPSQAVSQPLSQPMGARSALGLPMGDTGWRDGMRGNGFDLGEGALRWDLGRKIFTMRVVGHGHGLDGAGVAAPSLWMLPVWSTLPYGSWSSSPRMSSSSFPRHSHAARPWSSSGPTHRQRRSTTPSLWIREPHAGADGCWQRSGPRTHLPHHVRGRLPAAGADVLVEGDVEVRGRLVVLDHVKQRRGSLWTQGKALGIAWERGKNVGNRLGRGKNGSSGGRSRHPMGSPRAPRQSPCVTPTASPRDAQGWYSRHRE